MENERTINELKEKIKAMQEKIEQLENDENVYVDGAKFENRVDFVDGKTRWVISVKRQIWDIKDKPLTQYARVVSEITREEALNRLDYVINALTELKNECNRTDCGTKMDGGDAP